MKCVYVFVILMICCQQFVMASEKEKVLSKEDLEEVVHTYEYDLNKDGIIDYILMTDKNKNRVFEKLDTNHNNSFDDFFYYVNDVLFLREIDSNHNGDVDIRVYLFEGIYIWKYERDTNHDGFFDTIREYN